MRMTVQTYQQLQDGGAPEYMYHDRTAWRCAFFVGKKYGYPQGNAAHMGSISSMWISFASIFFAVLNILHMLHIFLSFLFKMPFVS
jgi:hypothetical protein